MSFFKNFVRLATTDLANQYAVPVKSLVGSMISRRSAVKSEFLTKACVNYLAPTEDAKILELGYGRGAGLKECASRLAPGKGMVFGSERSEYMEQFVQKKFILEIVEQELIRLDRAPYLRNLPYPNDFFSGIFHVDFFYFLHDESMFEICGELHRVLRPGAKLVSAMQFSRLRRLEKWGLLSESQWQPLRYLSRLEPIGFTDVKIEYIDDPKHGTYQMLTARKPDAGEGYFDPEERMRDLEKRIKRDLLVASMQHKGYKPTPEDLFTRYCDYQTT